MSELSTDHLRALIAHVSDVIALVDSDGRIAYLGGAVGPVLGYPPGELEQRMQLDLIHAEDRALAMTVLRRAADGEGPLTAQIRCRHRDGTWRTLEWMVAPAPPVYTPRSVIVTARDVTERKRLEDRLSQARKMEAIGRLAGRVAHDFNNLLATIVGYADMLMLRLSDPALCRDVTQIQRAGEQAAQMTQHLLMVSRQQCLQPVVLDLNDVLARLEPALGRVAGRSTLLSFSLDSQLGRIRIDPDQLQQAIVALVTNARDAMPDGGRMVVSTRDVVLSEPYLGHGEEVPPGRYALLTVADTGVGMDAETCSRAFEPFFSTKPDGAGMGLALLYGAIAQSGGHVSVYSEPGLGSTFLIHLPAVGEAVAPAGASGPAARSATILLVDDDEPLRRMVARALEQAQYHVLATSDPAEAVRLAADEPGGIDLLLADVVMPDLTGPELATRVREARPGLRVLFTSGYPDQALDRSRDLRDAAFIDKPFTPSQLVERVRAMLEPAE